MPESLMTTKEIAEYLKVKPATVQRWIRKGRLSAVRINNHYYRVDPDEMRKLITAA